MRFEVTVNVQAPTDHVWRCVTDPALVSRCVTGLESLTEVVPSESYRVLVSVPLGGRAVMCRADLAWLSREAPRAATLAADVGLATAGTAPPESPPGVPAASSTGHVVRTASRLRLEAGESPLTRLRWEVEITFLGSLAGMPPALLQPLVEKYSTAFFTCLKANIEASAAP